MLNFLTTTLARYIDPTGIYEIDDAVNGGQRMGEVSIWTGYNYSGKSTLLGQILLNAIDQEQVICAYRVNCRTESFVIGLSIRQQARNSLSRSKISAASK